MKTVSLYDPDTGRFSGLIVTGWSAGMVAAHRRNGGASIEGRYDHLSQRVNLATGQVEDWQPPPPPDTEMLTHAWDADTKRWIGQPTLANHKQRAAQAIKAQIAAIEATQPRAVREAILDGFGESSRSKLRDIEARIATARSRLAAIDAAPDATALAAVNEGGGN